MAIDSNHGSLLAHLQWTRAYVVLRFWMRDRHSGGS
jgi:hypothetical protein